MLSLVCYRMVICTIRLIILLDDIVVGLFITIFDTTRSCQADLGLLRKTKLLT